MDIAALYLFEEPLRDLSSGIDRRGTRAVSILLSAFPIVILYRLLTGSRDVGGVDDEALIKWAAGTGARSRIWALDFLLLDASNAASPLNCC